MKNNFLDQQAHYFDTYSNKINLEKFFISTKAEQIEFQYLISLMPNSANKVILDLGCGCGRHSLKIAKIAKQVIGIDISKESITTANKIAHKNNIKNFKGIVSNFKTVLYRDYFDYIIAINMLHHTNNPNLILKNIRLSLKNDGRLIVFEFNPLNPLFIPFLGFTGHFKSHFNKAYLKSNIFSLKKTIKKNGFHLIHISKYGFLPTALYNKSLIFKNINNFLNKIPIVNIFSAYHIIKCDKV